VLFEPVQKTFRKGSGGRRLEVSVFEDVVKEFVGEGREVADSSGRLLRS